MSIINASYFIDELRIPNNDSVDLTRINEAIERYEKECLKALLGAQLYKQFMQDIEEETPPQYVTDLLNGGDFSFNFQGTTINLTFEGLKPSSKKGLLAFFVYCKYRE